MHSDDEVVFREQDSLLRERDVLATLDQRSARDLKGGRSDQFVSSLVFVSRRS